MTDHARFQDDLKAYADSELAWPRRLAVRRHLTRCASCREELIQMTHIAEDLRVSDPADALDPALRAKILGAVAEAPGTGSAGLLVSESASDTEEGSHAPVLSRGATSTGSSPALEVPGARKRPALAWALAGAALAAWVLCFPMFQHVRENARNITFSGEAFKPQASETPPPAAYLRNTAPLSAGASAPSRRLGGGGGYPIGANGPSVDAAPAAPQAPASANPDLLQRQVHKEASIGVQVANPEAASDRVETMVKEAGGFVAGNTLNTVGDGLKTADMTVKVPVAQFETVLAQVARLGNVQSKNITGEDITEKASDADQTENVLEGDVQTSEARLKALGAKAKWSDQQATRDLRTQLAESRARLVLLKRMAALSTITIDLSQTPKPPAPVPGGFLHGLKDSTHDALQSLVSSASALIALVIWLLAYAPLWLPALLVGRYALREYRKRQAV